MSVAANMIVKALKKWKERREKGRKSKQQNLTQHLKPPRPK